MKQLIDWLLDNPRTITKESLELHYSCRNTMSVSKLLMELLQQERKSPPPRLLGTLFDPKNPPKGAT